ncbi:hypothetical protein [Edaphobacter bradus]|uniref:hypothetical protein n=1 Tax=Edaphobacter bradus TaxID=2259016 RepID=UPI0021E0E1E3|nr:hypothetical protein [Edaphobacter bradus]
MTRGTEREQTPEEIARGLDAFLSEHPRAVVLEDGRVVFEMREAKYRLAAEHGRCTLHLWSEDRNLVRRVSAVATRNGVLRLSTHRFGQTKPQTLELVADRDRRTPSARETTRVRYLRVLERVLQREFADWKVDGLRTAMDLEKSFGPAYARGSLVKGQQAWAVIAVNEEESPAVVDGILTLGILWLDHCRAKGDGRRVFQGLKVVVPRGMAALTASRMAWLNTRAAQWELWELDQASEGLTQREPADHGNLTTRLVHAPNEAAVRERFADATARVMALVPEAMRGVVELRVRSGAEVAFLLHGLEFARVRSGYAGASFNREDEITFGAGANETPLTGENEGELGELVARLFERRHSGGDKRDPLYRMQPERWLENVLRRDVEPLDARLNAAHVYTQVPAFAAGDRGMLDLLGVTDDGRLAVIELKADDDLHLALQGLDYWVRVRWHHRQTAENAGFGLGEFQRLGYFGGVRLSEADPRLYLVAPSLRVHPATEVVLRYISPQVEWVLVALDERWREKVKAVWRKRSVGTTA